jgi:hypothetical protein
MTTLSTPYRNSEKPIAKMGPKHGIIFVPVPHKCKPPGFWLRAYYWLHNKPVIAGCLYRCQCGKVWEWWQESSDHCQWTENSISKWKDNGGVE